jgi:hypothetical protein
MIRLKGGQLVAVMVDGVVDFGRVIDALVEVGGGTEVIHFPDIRAAFEVTLEPCDFEKLIARVTASYEYPAMPEPTVRRRSKGERKGGRATRWA